jgi:hypothetical protein
VVIRVSFKNMHKSIAEYSEIAKCYKPITTEDLFGGSPKLVHQIYLMSSVAQNAGKAPTHLAAHR